MNTVQSNIVSYLDQESKTNDFVNKHAKEGLDYLKGIRKVSEMTNTMRREDDADDDLDRQKK